jgi:hypothetical protein
VALSGEAETQATKAATMPAPSWIVGNWNPRDTGVKDGVNPNIVYNFTSDWKVTWTASGKTVATGRFRLHNPQMLMIDWSGSSETYDAIMLPGESMFTLRLQGKESRELRYSGN